MSLESFDNINDAGPKKVNIVFMILLTFAALAATVFLPFFGFVGLAFMPVPAALLISLKRYRDALICAIAGIIIMFIFNYLLAIVLIAAIAAITFYYRSILAKNRKVIYSILCIFGVFAASILLYLLIDSAIFNHNSVKQMLLTYNDYVKSISSDPVLDYYKSLFTADSSQMEALLKQTQEVLLFIPKLAPGLLIVFVGLSAVFNYYFTFLFFKKNGVSIEQPAAFKEWDIPWYFCWGVIAGIVCVIVPQFSSLYDGIIDIIGYNLLVVFGFLYLMLGASTLWGLLERFKIRNAIKIFILAIIFLFFGFIIVLPVLGLIDIWANFRKLNRGQ